MKALLKKIFRFFTIEAMLGKTETYGEIPATGTVYKNFMKVAWPSALESFLVAMIGVIDTMMVGTLGDGAIAAVGITNQPKFIMLAVIFSLNVGITAVVARRKGQGDRDGANRTLKFAVIASPLAAMIAATLGNIFAEPLLIFCGAEESYLADAITYFKILTVSVVFQALSISINAAQRGAGYTKISMQTNMAANAVNVVFNYLLINGIGFFPKLGVKGAAIATLLGTIVACGMSVSMLFKKKNYLYIMYKCGNFLNKSVIQPVVKVSGSAFVEQVFMRIGFLIYAIIVAKLGTVQYETHLICMNILTISFSFGDGFAVAASALVGQNLGAERKDLASVYGKAGQRISFMVSTVLFAVFILGRSFLVDCFTENAEIVALGANILIIVALTTHMQTSQVVFNGCLRGAGDTTFVAITSLVSVAFIRPFISWLLCFPLGLGLYGAWFGLFADQGIRFALSAIRFYSGKWQRIRL